MKDGASWEDAADTGETYDLIVVGGGISGLAAAHFFRKSVGAKARILVLDNHDDFGGHAKRNEFTSSNGRFLIGYDGSQSIDTPSGFSHETKELFEELGIELERFHGAFDDELYSSLGLSRGTFFDRENFGTDRLVVRRDLSWEDFAALMPLDPETQRDLVRLHEEPKDYLAELAPDDESSAVRIRLESTVVRAESDRDGVNVTYLRGGQASRVRGRYAVLACWNSLIPYLCPELPEEQKKALSYAVKVDRHQSRRSPARSQAAAARELLRPHAFSRRRDDLFRRRHGERPQRANLLGVSVLHKIDEPTGSQADEYGVNEERI